MFSTKGTSSTLHYKTQGKGSLNFILIHNAGGDLNFMAPQAKFLSTFAKTLSIDLLGHGLSPASKTDYSIKSQAEEILQLAESLNIKNSILIGLNYGANIAIEIANIAPGFSNRLILIDPPILMEPWALKLVKDHILDLEKSIHEDYVEELTNSLLFQSNEENKKIAINSFKTISAKALASTYRNLLTWDESSPSKLKNCTMPTLYIQTNKSFCCRSSMKKHIPHAATARVVGSGFWATIEVPDQINSMVSTFLKAY